MINIYNVHRSTLFFSVSPTGTSYRVLGTLMLKVEAEHYSKFARKATAEVAQGLQRGIVLARDVQTPCSRATSDRKGQVVGILWVPGQKALALSEFGVVRMGEHTGPERRVYAQCSSRDNPECNRR